jgi:hypothetical protein
MFVACPFVVYDRRGMLKIADLKRARGDTRGGCLE